MQPVADIEAPRQRRDVLRQGVAVDAVGEVAGNQAILDLRRRGRPCAGLALSRHHIGDDLAVEQNGRRRQRQHARVAPDGVAVLPAHAARRVEQGLGVNLLEGFAPTVVIDDEGVADRQHLHARRRLAQVVELAVRAHHARRLDIASRIVQRAARDVEHGPLMGHDLVAVDVDGSALGGPFADAVRRIAQMAADLDQTARRVIAVAFVPARAAGQQDQIANVDPDVVVLQPLAFAVQRRVAQFERLDVHLQIVRGHIHDHVAHARNVQFGAIINCRALHRHDRDLAALGDGL
ncbi:hypothetical protein D3C73_653020 [compost metagenome]